MDPATKAFALSSEGVTRSLDSAREEAAKCVLLCANCHAEVEAGQAQPAKEATRELPGVDSNHQELINSQSCCRYITGERCLAAP